MNHALRNIAAQSLRMHVCWGNYGCDHDIAQEGNERYLETKPSAIQFEASNPRHAEWIVWKNAKIPEDKILIPGLRRQRRIMSSLRTDANGCAVCGHRRT
jgi:5-methyltetrahydropteroyltriglutamate--homocysteine methyltransferase